jgi:hypothetical protein
MVAVLVVALLAGLMSTVEVAGQAVVLRYLQLQGRVAQL